MSTSIRTTHHHGNFEHLDKSRTYCLSNPHDFEVQLNTEAVSLRFFNLCVVQTNFATSRKLSVLIRMALPALGVGLTIYQVLTVISHHSLQQYRTLLASFDILLATFTSNAVILGSLLKDRGYKKEKYKYGPYIARRPGGGVEEENKWESDEELMQPNYLNIDKDHDAIEMRSLRFHRENGERLPRMPPAKLSKIRVESTWEIKVSDKDME